MRKKIILLTMVCFVFSSSLAYAENMSAEDVVTKMKKVFEPADSVTREIFIDVKHKEDTLTQWRGCEARKTLEGGQRILILIKEPDSLKGFAILLNEPVEQMAVDTWIYPPALRRVRKIKSLLTYEPFLQTDFTYSDLSFFDTWADQQLLAKHAEKTKDVIVLQTTPRSMTYYSKIITLINAKTYVPIKRYYYDVAGDLWKTLEFSNINFDSNHHLSSYRMEMKNLYEDTSTVWTVTLSQPAPDLPASYFTPEKLPDLMNSSICP